jgi:acetolactate synthase I/II/III large subunit
VSEKYADVLMSWLREAGYTHCFFVAGGNSMHLLDGARRTMTCVPFVHEVAAGIAAEYFNEAGGPGSAFVLITAGPGLTNLVSALAGAYLESRELLVIGGQVKSTDLASCGLRQRGIQEIDGVAIAAPVTVAAERVEQPISQTKLLKLVSAGRDGRPGPVFIEVCLDAQGAPVDRADLEHPRSEPRATASKAPAHYAGHIVGLLRNSSRPVWLLGGGVPRGTTRELLRRGRLSDVPLMTTWNGADRIPADHPNYFGRPNTWGQRYANVLIQQADLIVAFGTRLGLQQTGFNWQAFAPLATVVQIDIDPAELGKGHPRIDLGVEGDAGTYLEVLASQLDYTDWGEWVSFCRHVQALLPLDEPANQTGSGYLNPYSFVLALSEHK